VGTKKQRGFTVKITNKHKRVLIIFHAKPYASVSVFLIVF